MSDPTLPELPPSTCPHPDCNTLLKDAEGGACPVHSEWFAEQIAACDAGEGVAIALYAESGTDVPSDTA